MSQDSSKSSKMDVDFGGTMKEQSFPKAEPLAVEKNSQMSVTMGNMGAKPKQPA